MNSVMHPPAYTDIRARMATAAEAVGRSPSDITLVAVSKEQPWDRIAPVLAAGQRVFGENRVQEAEARWLPVKADYPNLELRLIGSLQSNKAEDAVRLFDVIETLDRPKLAAALRAAMDKTGRCPKLYVQVNTGEEPQKAGIAPRDLPAFLNAVRLDHGLAVEGLMCIPPVDDDPRLHFALLARLARVHGLSKLSMGMSADFEAAIRLGATSVRVGSALFGSR